MYNDIPIGPVDLVLGGTSLGLTDGGTVLRYNVETVKTTADKTGTTARHKMVTGQELLVVGKIVEPTLEQLGVITGFAVTNGATKDELTVKNRVGEDLVDDCKTLILKPLEGDVVSTDDSTWIYVPKASILPTLEVPHDLATQKAFGFTIEGHPVLPADIATGGFLYNAGSPEYAAGDLLRFGKKSTP